MDHPPDDIISPLTESVNAPGLSEAQDIAEAVLDAEARIEELTKEMAKSKGGRPSETVRNNVESYQTTKAEQLQRVGIKQDTAERFERIAAHPKAVEAAKEQAREEGRIVTRQDVLNRIPAARPKQQRHNHKKRSALADAPLL